MAYEWPEDCGVNFRLTARNYMGTCNMPKGHADPYHTHLPRPPHREGWCYCRDCGRTKYEQRLIGDLYMEGLHG